MKRLILALLLLFSCTSLLAQLYHPGEVLNYRIGYRAKMFPNTEVGAVDITTTSVTENGQEYYIVEGKGRTMPRYRLFFKIDDTYRITVDPRELRPLKFTSDIREGDYFFESEYRYLWDEGLVKTRWSSRKRPFKEKQMAIDEQSMDPISLFFKMRAADRNAFVEGKAAQLHMVLQDTIRTINYRYLGREYKKIRNMGKFRTLKFECQLGTSEGFSFTDGTVFTIWISDDENKIPLYIESPVKVGSISGYISGYKGLKYPLESHIK